MALLFVGAFLGPIAAHSDDADDGPGPVPGKLGPVVPPKAFLLEVGDVRAKSGRVPRGYGALGLTKDQKERVYGIQEAYAGRIEELEAEIERLKEEQFVRIKAVLNNAQRMQIERYELEAAKKKAKAGE